MDNSNFTRAAGLRQESHAGTQTPREDFLSAELSQRVYRHPDRFAGGRESRKEPQAISKEDRRVLLGANLRLLTRRFESGLPVLRGDVARMVSLADDSEQAV